MDHEHEKLIRTTIFLEAEVLEELEKTARQLETTTGRRWSRGGVIRLALSDFYARQGKIL
ncbi:MAG: hypothetical protein JSV13_11115 [Nitrospiraceae bacterium]|jgi:hypothetical protein|nr:MAG: hypothetical protein JSV13_11115 [Nitrospiraceae bacterium]